MSFGNRLRDARKAKGFSGESLGKTLSHVLGEGDAVSKQTISHWENGRYEPSLRQIEALCPLLGVSADWLICGKQSQELDLEALQFAQQFQALSQDQRAKWVEIISIVSRPPSPSPRPMGRVIDEENLGEPQPKRRRAQ